MVPVFGEGVAYGAEPSKMAEQMHMLYPALRNNRMRTYTEIVARETQDAIANWGDEGEIEASAFFGMLTNYTSSSCLLGKEFRNEMRRGILEGLLRPRARNRSLGLHPPLPTDPGFPAARSRSRAPRGNGLENRRGSKTIEIPRRGFPPDPDGLRVCGWGASSRITKSRACSSPRCLPGHHTSSVTAAWTLLELLRDPQFLSEVREEIRTRYANEDAYTFQSLRELEKTEGAVKEALTNSPAPVHLAAGSAAGLLDPRLPSQEG